MFLGIFLFFIFLKKYLLFCEISVIIVHVVGAPEFSDSVYHILRYRKLIIGIIKLLPGYITLK